MHFFSPSWSFLFHRWCVSAPSVPVALSSAMSFETILSRIDSHGSGLRHPLFLDQDHMGQTALLPDFAVVMLTPCFHRREKVAQVDVLSDLFRMKEGCIFSDSNQRRVES